ncbi:MAG: acyltransferase [Rhizonema sp. NSF051]|nr:acyltransferase [Rhizonema sp. NSF051]
MQTVIELRKKVKGQSFPQIVHTTISDRKFLARLIYTDMTKVFYSLNLIRYRLRYPNVNFGSDVKIRGSFSIKGNGQVEIGNNCAFLGNKNLQNKLITGDATSKITIGNNCVFKGTTLSIEENGQIEIGHSCSFAVNSFIPNQVLIQDKEAKVSIGDYCYFNGATVMAKKYIEFKRQCLVSDSMIVDTNYHSVEINRMAPNAKEKVKPIYVGENVWLGSRSVIMKGVSIGNNSVIGLGTIVRQPVPENVIVIGNPQQIVKKLDTNIPPYICSEV